MKRGQVMENKFLKFYSQNRKEELKHKWKILDYLEEEFPEKTQTFNENTSTVKISTLRKLFSAK
jgi:5-methylthioribose kinase